jgi:4-hydroxy-4-methyl-2-oxoglutarate aldolase
MTMNRAEGDTLPMKKSPKITPPMMRKVLFTAVVCDALDSLGFRHQSPLAELRPITGITKLVGRCRTTLWAEMAHDDPKPYELELKAIDALRPDEVFIAAAGGTMRSGIWGELLTTAARNGGCVGAIIDGAVRDVAKMTEMKFPVFARGMCPLDSLNRQRVIDIDVPVEVGGVRVCSGDLIFADIDGIVVVPREVEAEAIQRAWEKAHTENRVRDAIRGGMKAVDAFEKFGVL